MADPIAELVEELYTASLSRLPSAEEADKATKYLQSGSRGERAQDLLWALVNSKAFLYNH